MNIPRDVLNQPAWSEGIQRAGDIKGDLLQDVERSVSPSLTVLDMTAPEYAYLRRERGYAQCIAQAAVAAQYASCAWAFAAGGFDTIAIVDAITIANVEVGASYYEISLQTGYGYQVGTAAMVTDSRSVPTGGVVRQSLLRAQGVNTPAYVITAGDGIRVAVNGGDTVRVPLGWVLVNGNDQGSPVAGSGALVVSQITVNRQLTVSVQFRERQMLVSER